MKTSLRCENPDGIQFTLKITMSAKEWETLRGQLSSGYPAWKLTAAINDLLEQTRKVYWPKDDDE